MGTSESDFSLTESFEGYARALPNGDCESYFDTIGGVWTIGFGSTGPDIRQGLVWSRVQASARLQSDWLIARTGVLNASPVLVNYPNRLNAVTDFAYNLGVARYAGSSMRSYINRQAWANAANEFPKWNLGGGKVVAGLVRRRAAEQALFQTPDGQAEVVPVSSPLPLQTPAPDSSDTSPASSNQIVSLIANFGRQLLAIFRSNN